MDTVYKIIKGILLWGTALSAVLWLICLEGMITEERWGTLILWFLGTALAINLCIESISLREFYILSGTRLIRKILKD